MSSNNLNYGESKNEDQASGLRSMQEATPVQVIAVTAGKGGVGKSNVSVNLAIELSKQNKRVMLLDADLGLANVDIMLGLHPKHNLSHVLNGDCDLKDIIIEGPEKIQIIPSSSGIEKMTKLSQVEHAGVINAFNELANQVDILIVDTAAGISDSVISFTRSAQEIIVVVCDEPTSITDAYAMVKVLSNEYSISNFHILANMVNHQNEGRTLFNKLNRVADQFLSVNMDYMGAIPYDADLRKAVKQQNAVTEAYPNSKAAEGFKKIAEKVVEWPVKHGNAGQTAFFIEKILQSA